MILLAKLMVWLLVLLVYGILRRWTDAPFAAVFSLILLTMPAVVYGMGSGQVETRISLLALAAAWMIYMVWKQPTTGNAAMAGALCGGVVAAKYTGLLFAPAAGFAILLATRNPKLIGIALLTGLIVGGQWYVWLDRDRQSGFSDTVRPTVLASRKPDGLRRTHTFPRTGNSGRSARAVRLSVSRLLGCLSRFRSKDAQAPAGSVGPCPDRDCGCSKAGARKRRRYIRFGAIPVGDRADRVRDRVLCSLVVFRCIAATASLLPAVPLVVVLLALLSFKGAGTKGPRRLLLGLAVAVSMIQLGGWAFYHDRQQLTQ